MIGYHIHFAGPLKWGCNKYIGLLLRVLGDQKGSVYWIGLLLVRDVREVLN